MGKGRLRLLGAQKGLTLIEVLLALGLLALIGVGMLRAIEANARATGILDERVVADSLATSYLETIRKSLYSNNYTAATANITIPFQYSVVIDTYGSNNGTGWVYPSSNQTLQKIILSVWHGGKRVLEICTYRANQ